MNLVPPQQRTAAPGRLDAAAHVHDILRRKGEPLAAETRTKLERRLGHAFADVRIHADARAARSAARLGANAYTVGQDIVFGADRYRPQTMAGDRLLAHELAHVVHQSGARHPAGRIEIAADPALEREADAAAHAKTATGTAPVRRAAAGPRPVIQAQFARPSTSVRLPVAEELATQLSTIEAGVHGRQLTPSEIELASSIFGTSIDFTRVRLIPGPLLNYRTVGNTIRVPNDFTIADDYMSRTFIHELTHVWQYQHGGTSYISIALGTQLVAMIETGSRNAAYDYLLTAHSTFFDFRPEQQALIVENYFSMLRDRTRTTRDALFQSNHVGPGGDFTGLSYDQRQAEIARELPLHERLINQLRNAVPRTEAEVLMQRASEVMRVPGQDILSDPERQLTPVRPLLELRF